MQIQSTINSRHITIYSSINFLYIYNMHAIDHFKGIQQSIFLPKKK